MKEQHGEAGKATIVEGPVAEPVRKKRTLVVTPAVWFAAGGITLLVAIVAFVGGLGIGRLSNALSRTTTVNRNTTGMRGQFNDDTFGSGYAPTTSTAGLSASGAITAVSSTSITVKDTRTGQAVTFAVTSSTSVTNAGTAAAVSDLKVGDTVRVQSASTTSTDATLIELNPVTRGRGMMGEY